MDDGGPERSREAREFEHAAEGRPQGFFSELTDFLLHNKKWWLTPIVLVLLLFGLLVVLGATGLSPFIYTLF
jgi:hypothetical protein